MTGDNDTDPFDAAFDRREEQRILSEIDMSFRRAGLSVEQAEGRRVANLIQSEQRYRVREQDRQLAQLEVKEGVYVNIGDSVLEPTDEWLQHGDIRKFTPRQPKGTVRTISTVRRVTTSMVTRMCLAGKITDAQFAVCVWYRSRYDAAGLDGRYKTSHISLAGNTGGGGGNGQAPVALHEYEAEARADYRAAHDAIRRAQPKFFEAIVLHDIPLRRATRFARCRDARAFDLFRRTAEILVRHCQISDVDFSRDDDDADD